MMENKIIIKIVALCIDLCQQKKRLDDWWHQAFTSNNVDTNWTLRNTFQRNHNQITVISISNITFENVYKMSVIFCSDLCLSKYNTQYILHVSPVHFTVNHWRLGNFGEMIFKLMLMINGGGISWNCPRWMSLDLTDNMSTLVQVMAWCWQATSHRLSLCWLRPVIIWSH